ncbi:MAG TPA: hypothetical protein PKL49_10335 [Steroidobacteraceae bacterium]|nr:hypothetical protein [Steroidobacteraceae bacterium]
MPRIAAVATAILVACPLLAGAQEPARASDTLARALPPPASPITDRFALRATYYQGGVDTKVRLDPDALTLGTLVDGEETLGLDDTIDQGRMELYLRMGERFRLRFDYFKLNRFAATTLGEDVVFGDETFLTGEAIESSLDYRSLSFTFLYSILRRENIELAAGLGVNLLEAEVAGEAVDRNVREDESGVAPLPTIALDGSWQFARRWSVNARGQYFSATYDDIDGTLGEWHLDVQYRWKPNFAVGLGYTILDIDVSVAPNADHDFPGIFRMKTDGPELFIRASF